MPSLKGPVVGLLISLILTVGGYFEARDIAAGIRHEYTGRRAFSKKAFASILEALGPTGTLVAGILVCAAMIAWLVVTLKKRKEAAAKG